MGDDEKGAAGPAAASKGDPRTAEVLRALERARGTVARSDGPAVDGQSEGLLEALTSEAVALREERSRAVSSSDEIARRLAESTRSLERLGLAANDRLQVVQKAIESGLKDLRAAADGVGRQAAVVAARLNQQRKQIVVLSAVLVLLLLAGLAFVWDAHRLAKSTHDILRQILENQTKAQSGKGAKR